MTLEEIKAATLANKIVHWQSSAYTVEIDNVGQWLIYCSHNGNCIGLTWRDGVTLNGEPEHFYLERPE